MVEKLSSVSPAAAEEKPHGYSSVPLREVRLEGLTLAPRTDAYLGLGPKLSS